MSQTEPATDYDFQLLRESVDEYAREHASTILSGLNTAGSFILRHLPVERVVTPVVVDIARRVYTKNPTSAKRILEDLKSIRRDEIGIPGDLVDQVIKVRDTLAAAVEKSWA